MSFLKNGFGFALAALLSLLLAGCVDESPSPATSSDLNLRIQAKIPAATHLGKGAVIQRSKLILVFSSTALDTVRDTLTPSTTPALSALASDSQVIAKKYTLKGLRLWKVVATVWDAQNVIIHRDSASMGSFLKVTDTVLISLGLIAKYSMYEARFLTIPDSISSATGTGKQKLTVNRLVLKIDGVTVRDSTASPFTALATHTLAYDYVTVGTGTWTSVASGTTKRLYAVQFPNGSDTGYAVGDSVRLRTTNGGTNWTVSTDLVRTMRYVSFSNGSKGMIGGDSAFLFNTTNAGATWGSQKLNTFTQAAGPVFLINDTGLTLTNSATLTGSTTYRYTINGGAAWTPQSGYSYNVFALSCVGTANCWAVGYKGLIRRNSPFSGGWGTSQAFDTNLVLRGVSFVNATTGWTVGDSGKMFKTTNAGATWNPMSSPTTQTLNAVHFLDASLGFAVGNSGTILHTLDGGTSWKVQTSGTTANLNGVWFSGTKGYVVGDAGTLIRLTDIHVVQMIVYGSLLNWPVGDPLYSGTRYLSTFAGRDTAASLTLNWLGPNTGTANLSATIGRVGKTTVEGTVPGQVFKRAARP